MIVEISVDSQQELQHIFETGEVPDGHFLALAPWHPLIYGADGPQRVYLNLLLDSMGNDAERDVTRFPKADFAYVSNYYIDWSTQGSVEEGELQRPIVSRFDMDTVEAGQQEVARRAFARRFNASHSRLGNLSAHALGQDAARTQRLVLGVLKDNSTLHPTSANMTTAVRGAVRQFAARRACKFLIYDAINQGRAIAYALDDLDLGAVVDKTAFELETQPGRFKVPVCTSELREMFRRWDVCHTMVHFFHDLHAAHPPWHASRGLPALQAWSAYAAARAIKLADRLGVHHPKDHDLRQVQVLHGRAEYERAIAAYHATGPSALSPLHRGR